MKEWKFDLVARTAADLLDRRSVLGLIGGGVLAGVIGPSLADAADNKDKKNKKIRKMCKGDYRDCKSYSLNYCDTYYGPPQSDQCKSDTLRCCNFLKKCTRKDYKKANTCADQITW